MSTRASGASTGPSAPTSSVRGTFPLSALSDVDERARALARLGDGAHRLRVAAGRLLHALADVDERRLGVARGAGRARRVLRHLCHDALGLRRPAPRAAPGPPRIASAPPRAPAPPPRPATSATRTSSLTSASCRPSASPSRAPSRPALSATSAEPLERVDDAREARLHLRRARRERPRAIGHAVDRRALPGRARRDPLRRCASVARAYERPLVGAPQRALVGGRSLAHRPRALRGPSQEA